MTQALPHLDEGTHAAFIKTRIPAWLNLAHGEAIKALHQSQVRTVDADADAALVAAQARSQRSRHAAARALEGFKGIVEFAEPLLVAGLKSRFGLDVDVHRHEVLHFGNVPRYSGDVSRVKLLSQQSLLQAALRNFSGAEAFTWYCALAPLGASSVSARFADDGTLISDVVYREKLAIKPDAFRTLCRDLDLGQAYQQHLNEVFARPDVAPALIAASRDAFIEQVHGARLKQQISASMAEMLLALAAGRNYVTLDGRAVRCSSLQLLGTDLDEVLVIGPDPDGSNREQRCIAYIPGDPNHPLKEYSSRHGLTVYLREQLYRSQYLKFFLGFVLKREQARVYSAFNVAEENLPKGEHVWREVPISGEPFAALHTRRLHKMRDDARVLAVPNADVDHAAWLKRLNHHLSLGLNVMNVAAFFVPGLGELMLAVMGAQLLGDVFHGIEAWEAGDSAEAAGYMQSLALNVAVAAGLGVVGHQLAVAVKPSAWVESLEPVELPNGQPRLWRPDLAAYRQAAKLPDSLAPNVQGQYAYAGKQYIRLDDVLYEQYHDTRLDRWRLRHPSDARAYQPLLQHNGQGAWRLVHERPLQWSRTRLLRRIGHSVEGLSDAELEQALTISGVHEDVLRRMHVAGEPVPPLLADTLERMQIDRRVEALIGQIRHGQPIPEELTYPLALVVELPGWPEGGVLQVFTGATLEGARVEYGDVQGQGPRLKIGRAEFLRGELPERVIDQLNEMQIKTLLGDGVGLQREERVQALRDRLADYAAQRRDAIFDSVYQNPAPAPDPQLTLLRERFTRLNAPLARRLLGAMSERERTQWTPTTPMPERLVNMATRLSGDLPLVRAYEGLYRPALAQAHSDRLLLVSLGKLPGWSSQVCLELRGGQTSGPLLQRLGSPAAPIKRVLVKSSRGYRAYEDDEALHSLAGTAADNDLYKAVLHALPDAQRDALKLGLYDSERLRARVLSIAAGGRSEAGQWLWSGRVSGWGESGRLRGGGGNQSRQASAAGYPPASTVASRHEQRYRELYPQASAQEAQAQFDRWGVQGLAPRMEVLRLEGQFNRLKRDLARWATGNINRENAASRILEAWQRVSTGLTVQGESTTLLFLRGQGLSTNDLLMFPQLSADFAHVGELWLDGNGLTDIPTVFTRNFPALHRVSANQNRLTSIPAGLSRERLTALDLSYNRIRWDDNAQTVLAGCTHLQTLELSGNPLSAPPDLSALTELSVVRLSESDLSALPTGLEALQAPVLVDLGSNAFEVLPGSISQLPPAVAGALNLEDNPLNAASLRLIEQHFADHHVDLLVSDVDYRFLLEGATPAQRAIWQRLRTPANLEFCRELRYLPSKEVFDVAPVTARRRLWALLEWMDSNETFRQQALANEALHLFNLELTARIQRAHQIAAPRQQTEQLLALATDYIRIARIDTQLQNLTDVVPDMDDFTFETLGQLCFKHLATDPALVFAQAPAAGEEVNVDRAQAGALELLTPQWLDELRLEVLDLDAGSQEGLDAILAVNADDEPLFDFWYNRLHDRYQERFNDLREALYEQLEHAEATLDSGPYVIRANELRKQFDVDNQALMKTLTREIFEGTVSEW